MDHVMFRQLMDKLTRIEQNTSEIARYYRDQRRDAERRGRDRQAVSREVIGKK